MGKVRNSVAREALPIAAGCALLLVGVSFLTWVGFNENQIARDEEVRQVQAESGELGAALEPRSLKPDAVGVEPEEDTTFRACVAMADKQGLGNVEADRPELSVHNGEYIWTAAGFGPGQLGWSCWVTPDGNLYFTGLEY